MKLNITNEKLIRMLLSANPILINCKGSVKAVRMFMNMIGMKCKVILPTENTDIQLYVSNVADAELKPVKSIIAKQLQEVLPINMIVLPENIIGCSTNE